MKSSYKLPALCLGSLAFAGAGLLAVASCGSADAPATAEPVNPGATTSPSSKPTASSPVVEAPDATTPKPDAEEPDAAIEPATRVRFVAIGDQGKGCATPTDGQCKVAAALEAKCAQDGCDFGVLLGDNIYPSGATSPTDPIFQTIFEEPYKNLNFPFYVAIGNHDCGGDGAGTDFARCEHEIAYTQNSQKWKLPSRHYKQKLGGSMLELFVADTNSSMVGTASSALLADAPKFKAQDDAQRADFKVWTSTSKAVWKIAMGHHPFLSNGKHGNAGSYDCQEILGACIAPPAPFNGKGVESFLNDAVCGRVDLYLSGHDHSRQWLVNTCKGTELIVSGGGATTTELPGSNATHFQKQTIGFVYILVEEKKLVAEFIDETGAVEFTRTLTKP